MPRLLATLALVLTLAACGGDDDSDGSAGISNEGNEELFTTAGFQEAYDAVLEKAGEDAGVLQLQITTGGANFKLRDGEQATGFVYTGGEVVDEEVEIIGGGSIEGQDFPIADIDPAAIDLIRDGVVTESGLDDIEITVMTLEKQPIDGELRWVVNAEGGGRTGLVFNADLDGSNVTSPTGDIAGAGGATDSTTPEADTPPAGAGAGAGGGTPPSPADGQAIAKCVTEAQGDIDKIQACAQQ